MAHDSAVGGQRGSDHVAAPGVEVGAADAGLGDAEDDRARLGIGNGVLLDHKGLLVLLDDDGASSSHGIFLSRVRVLEV